MGFTTFITEKPSVAQEYRKVLQIQSSAKTDGYVKGYSPVLKKEVAITWAVGHLISLGSVDEQRAGKKLPHGQKPERWSKSNLPILPTDWVYTENGQTYAQYKIIKSLYTDKDLDAIYYAGDSGREGIYIQALIRNQIFKGKNPKCDERVVWIDSFTEEEILKGIRNAKPYASYQAMIDSGYERAISDWLIGMNLTEAITLTSSRSGVLNVGRVMTPTLAMVVERQKEIDNFKEQDFFGIKNTVNKATWKACEKSKFYNSDKLFNESGFVKQSDATALINELNKSNSFTVESVESKKKSEYAPLLFNLADLQAHCSKNYHLRPEQTLKVVQSLYEKKLTTYPRTDARVLSSAVASDIKAKTGKSVPSKYVDDSKITDHYAIIPTDYGKGHASLSGLEAEIYKDISLRFKAVFYPPYVYTSSKVTYLCPNGERFFENLKVVEELGYRELYGETINNPSVPQKGTSYNNVTFLENPMKTTPPLPYTTGTLILAMEKAGKLVEDEELREQIKTCGIGTSATRANIIEKLDTKEFIKIDKSQKVFATEKGMQLIPLIAKFDENLVSPLKTAEMEQKLSDIASQTLSVPSYEKDLRAYITSTVGNILSNNSERIGNVSSPSSNKNETNHPYNCPCCSKELKNGKFGYYCDKKDDGCGFSFGNEILGHAMKESDLKDLVEKGQTKVYSFTSTKGTKFKASLKVDKANKKTSFEFDNSYTNSCKNSRNDNSYER